MASLSPEVLAIRNATYRLFAELARAPEPVEVAAAVGRSVDEIAAAWRELHEAHALVLDGDGRIRMANPFSGVATPFVTEVDGKRYFANCGWDALGIGVALHRDSRVVTSCADCGEAMAFDVRGVRPDAEGVVFHVLVRARDWWSDVGFT